MENKKNNTQRRYASRIPLPVEPLPPLPKHVMKEVTGKMEAVRQPLETISQSNNASVPSSSTQGAQSITTEKKRPLKINSKHVTVRPKLEETLDWEFKIFRDESVTESDANVKKEVKTEIPSNEFELNAVTPPDPIQHKSVRNIKKSLKRPHSRELQGLLTPTAARKRLDENCKRRLLFNESLQEKLKSPDQCVKSYTTCLNRDYATDMFGYLLGVEKKPVNVPKTSSITRACVINWLMKINGTEGNPAVVQSACWFLDSMLGIENVSLQNIQLVATACYWISQKLHGSVVPAATLMQYSNHVFDAPQLLEAEKTVFTRLNFPPQPVVPQEFITYLSWYCDQSHPGEIEVAATFLAMAGMMVDKSLCAVFPSVIGAVAVRNAVLLLGKKRCLNALELCPLYRAAENKTLNIGYVSATLRRAVRTIADPLYQYRAPLEHYGLPPFNIAQKIVQAAEKMAIIDCRHTSRRCSTSFK